LKRPALALTEHRSNQYCEEVNRGAVDFILKYIIIKNSYKTICIIYFIG